MCSNPPLPSRVQSPPVSLHCSQSTCLHSCRSNTQWERERNVLFNDALNTFYLRLYGVRHMVKDHSDSEIGNPLPPHRLLLSSNSKVFLYAPSHRQDSTYYGLCYISRGALAGTRNSSMGFGSRAWLSECYWIKSEQICSGTVRKQRCPISTFDFSLM